MGGMTLPTGYEIGAGPIIYTDRKYAKGNVDNVRITAVDSRGNKSTSELKVNIGGVYFQARVTSAKAIREDGVGKKVRLIGTGKISEYEASLFDTKAITIKYDVITTGDNPVSSGTLLPEYITYNDDNTFSFNGYINGDLGAEGFTQLKEFKVALKCSGQLNKNYPNSYGYFFIDKGQAIYDILESGVAFGGLYNKDLGGPLQVYGSHPLINDIITVEVNRHTQTFGDWVVGNIENQSIKSQIGNKLSFENNSIKIGKGVKKVLVSFSGSVCRIGKSGDFGIHFRKSGNEAVEVDVYSNASAGLFNSVSITPYIVEVEEGDVLYCTYIHGGQGDTEFLNCYYTVQVLEVE